MRSGILENYYGEVPLFPAPLPHQFKTAYQYTMFINYARVIGSGIRNNFCSIV